jgi:hypothetical protein
MVGTQSERLQIGYAILRKVNKAVYSDEALHTGKVARQLTASYPNCGMTLREIENEIIRQIGVAGGSAEMEHRTATRWIG